MFSGFLFVDHWFILAIALFLIVLLLFAKKAGLLKSIYQIERNCFRFSATKVTGRKLSWEWIINKTIFKNRVHDSINIIENFLYFISQYLSGYSNTEIAQCIVAAYFFLKFHSITISSSSNTLWAIIV